MVEDLLYEMSDKKLMIYSICFLLMTCFVKWLQQCNISDNVYTTHNNWLYNAYGTTHTKVQ